MQMNETITFYELSYEELLRRVVGNLLLIIDHGDFWFQEIVKNTFYAIGYFLMYFGSKNLLRKQTHQICVFALRLI